MSRWDKLSPAEFNQLQDFAAYSNRALRDVLAEFSGNGPHAKFNENGEISIDGFRIFMKTYLEFDAPPDLVLHLFLSFVKRKPKVKEEVVKKETENKIMPGRSTPGSAPNIGSYIHDEDFRPKKNSDTRPLGSLFNIFTEKLHSLTQLLSETQTRSRSGSMGAAAHSRMSVTRTSYSYHDALGKSSEESSPSHSNVSPTSAQKYCDFDVEKGMQLDESDINRLRVPLKDIVCYLSLLEGERPADKLECLNSCSTYLLCDAQISSAASSLPDDFPNSSPEIASCKLYDSDGNGVLDTEEIDCIVDQMMNVAEYLGWDVTELKPILQDMMTEIDYDSDGTVSLEEWTNGGLTTVPLLVLLGLDSNVKEDGNHFWRLKTFSRPAYCNMCSNLLVGLGKKGLCCVFCKYTVHERCVQRAPANCISTYSKSKKSPHLMAHHWIEGNIYEKCSRCRKHIKGYNGLTGFRCRWCQIVLHNRCVTQVPPSCTFGVNRDHVVPPSAIFPIVLDRPRTESKKGKRNLPVVEQGIAMPMSFQITAPEESKPLVVFINPKSGGRQGTRIIQKFQYLLNPRQVFNLSKEPPQIGLQMFKDVPNIKVICCGGDGTVGWVLDCIDKVTFEKQPSVGVLPLGTGNDLSRCLGWGGGYEGESLNKVLRKIEKSSTVMLDRWKIEISDVKSDDIPSDAIPFSIINNYFSIGVDAAICVKFHNEREKCPEKFNSRMKNKLWYFEFATSETFTASCKNLHEDVEIECDEIKLDLSNGPPLQGIAFINIPYIHGGSNLWGENTSRWPCSRSTDDISQAVQDIGDKMIEVVGLESCIHMGQVRTGLRGSGRRLAQCSSLVVETKKRFPMQIDGEPWMQAPCKITISHKNQAPMLMAPPNEKSKTFWNFFSI